MYYRSKAGEKRAESHARLLDAMCNPKRLQVLSLIVKNEWKVGDLASQVKLSQSALSQHLTKMRELNIVSTRRDAQTIFYSCSSPEVKKILSTLQEIYGNE